jgi:hypothetical protein
LPPLKTRHGPLKFSKKTSLVPNFYICELLACLLTSVTKDKNKFDRSTHLLNS